MFVKITFNPAKSLIDQFSPLTNLVSMRTVLDTPKRFEVLQNFLP